MYVELDSGVMVIADTNRRLPVPVINSDLGQFAIAMGHEQFSTCHLGINSLVEWVRARYWWYGMTSTCAKHVKSCITCQRNKFAASPGYGFMNMRYYTGPAQSIVIDIVVLRDGTDLFTIMDAFSHYPDAYIIADQEASTCAKALLQWVHKWGVPLDVRSDRGKQLNVSELFKEFGCFSPRAHPRLAFYGHRGLRGGWGVYRYNKLVIIIHIPKHMPFFWQHSSAQPACAGA